MAEFTFAPAGTGARLYIYDYWSSTHEVVKYVWVLLFNGLSFNGEGRSIWEASQDGRALYHALSRTAPVSAEELELNE